jgi:hypothetical protein
MTMIQKSSACNQGMLPKNNPAVSILSIIIPALLFISCRKENVTPGSASLAIIHLVAGSKPLAVNFSSEGPVPYKTGRQLNYRFFERNNQFKAYSGEQRLRLFQYPDTTNKDLPLFDLQLNLPIGSMNTLFLTGTVDAPDIFFTRNIIPFFPETDSSLAIRFVNLSPGNDPVSINVKGLANGSEVSSIRYKNITDFKNYAATKDISEYVFEFRDAISGDSITSYTIPGINQPGTESPNIRRYRSFTLALTGEAGGVGDRARAGFLVSH